ncbi:MAG: hypothetical protein QOJ00_393 [Actinomycetota bacterium]|jgi:hypothetical protein
MSRLIATVVVLVVAGVIALVLRRRQPAAPTQPRRWPVPVQVDRNDFTRPDAPWLVAVFSSSTCDSCASVLAKARVVEAPDVAFEEISYQRDKARHERYSVEAVPMVLVADGDGVVAKSFVGEVTAIDLWGAIATARDPSSAPQDPSGHDH